MKKLILSFIKKSSVSVFVVSSLLMFFGSLAASGQDNKTSKIHITITENDKVTTDTTYELKEGQDPEMVKKMIGHLAGGEMHAQMKEEIHKNHEDSDNRVWIISEEEGDSMQIKEIHGGKKNIMISEGEDDDLEKEIEVIVHDGEDMEWTEKGDDGNVEVYVIKKGGNDVSVEKKVKVIIEKDDKAKVETEKSIEKKKKK